MKPTIAILFLLFVFTLAVMAHGRDGCEMLDPSVLQYIVSRPVSTGTRQPDASMQFGWHKVEPLKRVNVAKLGKTLADIESRMPDGHIYRDADMITWAHETTHGINSRVRVNCGAGINALYCLDGYVGIFREPNVTKSMVCRYVPNHLRGDVFGLYMSGQGAWDRQPLYILDEWVAYINGGTVGIELMAGGGVGSRSLEHDIRHAIEFSGYASALLTAIDAQDPGYPDRAALADFVAWNVKRSIGLTQHHAAEHVQQFVAQYMSGSSCANGNCPPIRWNQGRYQPQQQTAQQPLLAPVPPKPVAQLPGLKGDKGDKGDKGPSGPAGDKADCVDEIAALRLEINQLKLALSQGATKEDIDEAIANLPPITFYNVDPKTGKPKGAGYTVPLGGKLGMLHQRLNK